MAFKNLPQDIGNNYIDTTDPLYGFGTTTTNTCAGIYKTSSTGYITDFEPISSLEQEIIASLGFVEDLVNGTYNLKLDAECKIPIGKLANLDKKARQEIIDKYLEAMKAKIENRIKSVSVINKIAQRESKEIPK